MVHVTTPNNGVQADDARLRFLLDAKRHGVGGGP